MFAKIFESIYDGTLADNWQAMVTFQQMLILADQSGVVDMTPAAIHRRTGIPTEIIEQGIAILEQPDPRSRSKDMEGRRIARLDPARDWGWFLVNHAQYRAKITAEEKREADRVRIAAKRAAEAKKSQPACDDNDKSHPVAECREASQEVAKVAHTDTERDTEAEALPHTSPQDPEIPGPDAPPVVCVDELKAAGVAISPAAALTIPLRQHGRMIAPSHPDVIAAAAEGVEPQAIVDLIAVYPDKPATYLIAAARRQRAEGAKPNARGSPRPNAITQNFEAIDYGN